VEARKMDGVVTLTPPNEHQAVGCDGLCRSYHLLSLLHRLVAKLAECHSGNQIT